MNKYIQEAPDIRESSEWANYLNKIGWEIKKIDNANLFIRYIPIFNFKFIKVQHQRKLNIKKIEKFAKLNSSVVVIEPHNFDYDREEFIKNGFRVSKWHYAPSATIRIDLNKTKENVFASFSENAKRNIKKAQRNNLKVKIIEMKNQKNMDYFEEYFKLLKELRKQKGFYAPEYKESYKKMVAFKNNSVLLFAYERDKPIAVIWLATYGKMICYMQTGVTKNGYKLLANYLLVWEGIKWAIDKKINVFDFESIYDDRYPKEHKKWKGYTEFKRRFHGEEIYYPEAWIKIYSPVFKQIYFLSTLFSHKTNKIYYSKINKKIEVGKSYRNKTIFVDGIPQSGGELSYMWKKTIKSLKNEIKIKNVLVLGVGAGDAIKEIQKNYPRANITGIEVDEEMINIAKSEFELKDKNLNLLNIDAEKYMNKNKKRYDLIICDIFIGAKNPKNFREKMFINLLGRSLEKNGIILFNSHYDEKNSNELKELLNVFGKKFKQVDEVFKFRRNKLFLLRSL